MDESLVIAMAKTIDDTRFLRVMIMLDRFYGAVAHIPVASIYKCNLRGDVDEHDQELGQCRDLLNWKRSWRNSVSTVGTRRRP